MGIFSAPLNGLMYVFKEINKRADKEMNDDEAIKAELVSLHSRLEAGDITEEAFEAKEMELVTRLTEIEERKSGPQQRRLPLGKHHRKAALPHVSRPSAEQAARAKAVALEPPDPLPRKRQPSVPPSAGSLAHAHH